jgi:hypothetical protein
MARAIDRLGRPLIDLLGTIQHLEAVGTWISKRSTRPRLWESCFRSPAHSPQRIKNVALERGAQRQLEKGVGILKVAKMLGLGTGTVQRIKQEMRAT